MFDGTPLLIAVSATAYLVLRLVWTWRIRDPRLRLVMAAFSGPILAIGWGGAGHGAIPVPLVALLASSPGALKHANNLRLCLLTIGATLVIEVALILWDRWIPDAKERR